ncbi:hydroxymethylbilane synthase [Acuticoccus sp. I52.16.1]|uniref:hydroxymethylbilane synthase n=1 Tax=Acuticoccus sp. I52.16.1 TaxID=2928472 RepID=UPI001FD140B9|nr:hydroxymethylbilane synthase [Acuticoccus sp. I52.16.1]UOM32804.1 hydroxymethylbilane synthase [Acuticoccus sp. I52.16.1]
MSTLTSSSPIRIGTRGSLLAVAQAEMVAAQLASRGAVSEIVVIKTTGDKVLDRPLSEIGGKGLFTKEIEAALTERRIDCAVHSAKDLETILPAELTLGAFLPREDVRDVFIGRGGMTLAELPPGATVGTASLRRQALVRRARPDLKCAVLRGNVQTRLKKLEAGECDGTLLALAGLNRLGIPQIATEILDPTVFVPACAQGAIAVEIRRDDDRMIEACRAIDDRATERTVQAERGFLAALDGSCRTPIAGLATISGEDIELIGLVAAPDGTRVEEITGRGLVTEAAEMGYDAGRRLRARVGEGFFELLA